MNKVSVVIPTYNEELAIADNVGRLVETFNNLNRDWELILVNDGSTDSTLNIINDLSTKNPKIKIVSYLPNRGRGFAMKSGFKAATGDYIITTESDLNWGSEIIGRFVSELDKGVSDIVIASPHMSGGGMENVPFLRWLLSYAGNVIFSMALPGKLTMVTGMTRGYRREVLDSLDLESNDKELHVEILYKAIDLGYKIKEIPAMLRWQKPAPGKLVRKSHFKMRMILNHLLLSFFIRPFLLFGTVGLFLIGIGVILGIYLLMLSLNDVSVSGRPAIFGSALFIVVGLQILVFGFLASQNRDLKRQLSRIRKYIKER